jgi:hypothetical protein
MGQGVISVGPTFAIVLVALMVVATSAALADRLGLSRATSLSGRRALDAESHVARLVVRLRMVANGLRYDGDLPARRRRAPASLRRSAGPAEAAAE